MWYELTIVADTNDADYVTSINKIDQRTLEKYIYPMAKAIKNFQPYEGKGKDPGSNLTRTHRHNYPRGDGEYIPRDDLGEKSPAEIYSHIDPKVREVFEEYLPCSEHGIHTIKSISICPWAEKMELLEG
jgi:hypothetical protein